MNTMNTMNQKLNPFALFALFAFIFILLFGTRMTYTVGPGEKAVVFQRFGEGLDKDNVKHQGFHLIAPWNEKYIYNVRIQEDLSLMEVLSKNGLTIKTELSYRYKPVDNKIGYVHDELGSGYHENIIIPEIRSVTREVIGEYLPEELYSTKREVIEDEIYERTRASLITKNLLLDAVLIRDVTLPKTLQDAIENKLKQEQMSLEYEFKIEQASKEAQRQIIEAEGKAKSNRILSVSLTDNVLKDNGIEATVKLSQSNNTKIVVVGAGEDGLPLILGN